MLLGRYIRNGTRKRARCGSFLKMFHEKQRDRKLFLGISFCLAAVVRVHEEQRSRLCWVIIVGPANRSFFADTLFLLCICSPSIFIKISLFFFFFFLPRTFSATSASPSIETFLIKGSASLHFEPVRSFLSGFHPVPHKVDSVTTVSTSCSSYSRAQSRLDLIPRYRVAPSILLYTLASPLNDLFFFSPPCPLARRQLSLADCLQERIRGTRETSVDARNKKIFFRKIRAVLYLTFFFPLRQSTR